LIRQDPSNAVAQVARIEEQVMKVAAGLRQLVDYLAVSDASASGRLALGPGVDSPCGQADAIRVIEDMSALLAPTVKALGAEVVVDVSALQTVAVDRWHALGVLTTLVSLAVRCAASTSTGKRRVSITGSAAPGWAIFELHVPGLSVMSGWHLEHFQPRPPATEDAEPYRELSICAAVIRGRGGKLQIEPAPGGAEGVPSEDAALVRFSYKT
jgi:hypothetical protein